MLILLLLLLMLILNINVKSFECKTKLLGKIVFQRASNQANRTLKNGTGAVPLKYISNVWGSLEMPSINCKIELKF